MQNDLDSGITLAIEMIEEHTAELAQYGAKSWQTAEQAKQNAAEIHGMISAYTMILTGLKGDESTDELRFKVTDALVEAIARIEAR